MSDSNNSLMQGTLDAYNLPIHKVNKLRFHSLYLYNLTKIWYTSSTLLAEQKSLKNINLCLTPPMTATGDIYIHHHFLKASIHTIGWTHKTKAHYSTQFWASSIQSRSQKIFSIWFSTILHYNNTLTEISCSSSQSLQANVSQDSTSNEAAGAPTSFPIHYSLAILSYDTMQYETQTVLLNQTLNK